MAETLVLCSRGTSNAIAGSIYIGIMLKGQGVDTAVFFYQEAVVPFLERKFERPPLLEKYAEIIHKNREKTGLTADVMDMLKMAKEAVVPVYVCGLWADLLDARDKLPEEMEVIEMNDAIKLFADAKRHIGA